MSSAILSIGKPGHTAGLRGLSLSAALLCILIGASPRIAWSADQAFVVTYQEIRSTEVNHARTLLQRQAASERAAAAGGGDTGDFHSDVLQELDRPERWVLLEWGSNAQQLASIENSSAADTAGLTELLAAPPDIRRSHALPATAGAQGIEPDGRPLIARQAFYEVTHLDIGAGAASQGSVIAAIGRLLQGARAAAGNLRAEAWQLDGHANHYTLLFVWRDRADRQAYAAGPTARQFRADVSAILGSPYDDRFYRLMN
jgi:quinol monooxygenase YgiN